MPATLPGDGAVGDDEPAPWNPPALPVTIASLTRVFCLISNSFVRQATQNAPSGIAQQLRKTSENNVNGAEPMNLDDFIFSDRAAASTGFMSPPPPPGFKLAADEASGASAIPIKSRRDSTGQFVPQSVPHHQRSQNDEFHYVTRHHRKTSIDERRVSPNPCRPAAASWHPSRVHAWVFYLRCSIPPLHSVAGIPLYIYTSLRNGFCHSIPNDTIGPCHSVTYHMLTSRCRTGSAPPISLLTSLPSTAAQLAALQTSTPMQTFTATRWTIAALPRCISKCPGPTAPCPSTSTLSWTTPS